MDSYIVRYTFCFIINIACQANFEVKSYLLIAFIVVGTGGGSADVTGMAPDGDPVSLADSWSKNN